MVTTQRYDQRGVSATKEEVHAAIKNSDKGLYPNAFCKIIPDYLGNDAAYCNVMRGRSGEIIACLRLLEGRATCRCGRNRTRC